MKTKTIIWISAFFILLVAALVTANFSAPVGASQNTAGSLFVQITPTLLPEGISEIGSTDGILIMGVVIALIAMVPVLISRNRK